MREAFSPTREETRVADLIVEAIKPLLYIDGLQCNPPEPSAAIEEGSASQAIAFILREARMAPLWKQGKVLLCPNCHAFPCECQRPRTLARRK